jgi:hypothetical protein
MQTGSNNSEILTIKEPNIKLDEIVTVQVESPNNEIADKSKSLGNSTPFVKINGYSLDTTSIIKFKINCAGFVPTISLAFQDTTKQFQNDFPKDGDLIELYIRSRNNDKIKKIRVNFDILNIQGFADKGTTVYKLNGIMRVPNLFSDSQFSLGNDTSYNHLLQVCDKIDLGFASNEVSTSDSMLRFNANNTIKDFIVKLSETIYKDDKSFFTTYVDLYYYLCLVNVNNLFSLDETMEEGAADLVSALTQDKSNQSEQVQGNTKILLSNHPSFDNSTNYITSYSLFNNAGDIWMSNGYKRYSQYMNMDTYEFDSFFVDPLTTDGSEKNLVILKGKAGDNYYENQNKYTYIGRIYSTQNEGNLHQNYHFAKILNYQNNAELNKMGLSITLKDISSSIYRFKRIPVAIYEKDGNLVNNANMRNSDSSRNQENENISSSDYEKTENMIANNFLSAFYVVSDFSINFENGKGFTQTVNLVRREWNMPYPAGIVKNKN